MTINNTIKSMLVLGGILAFLNLTTPIKAQYYSQNDQKLSIVVDKKISDITNPEYFDNIASTKKIFREKDVIDFKIVVQNSGNKKLENIKLVDYLPNYLQVVNAYNTVLNNTVETSIASLEVGETKTYNIRASIANTPVEKIINQKWQMTNKVCVSNDVVSDCDNASYFVGGKVMPITGNEGLLIQTIALFGTGILAVGLKKTIRGY